MIHNVMYLQVQKYAEYSYERIGTYNKDTTESPHKRVLIPCG